MGQERGKFRFAIAHAFYGKIPANLLDPVLDIYMCPDLFDVARTFCERFAVEFR
jgi:hypothetical protein